MRSCLFKLFLFRVMLLRRRRRSLSPLASPRYRARSDGQDRPPLPATSPLRAHLASPRTHARILHVPSSPYLPGLPRMTPPSLSLCAPTPQSHGIFRPRLPNLRARCQDRVLCAPHLAVPPPSSLPPSPSAGDSLPLSSYISPTADQPPSPACPPANLLPVPPPLAHPPPASSSSPAGSPWTPRDAPVYARTRLPRLHPRSRGGRG